MTNLAIAQIQNAALKAVALEVDESGKKDGFIDSSEINVFRDKATILLNEKKCTAQEFTTLFGTKVVEETNGTDVFLKLDSIHNVKKTPSALAKEALDVKIKEVKAKIASNDEKLKLYETRLAQKEIANTDYLKDVKGEKSFKEKADEILVPLAVTSVFFTSIAFLAAIVDGGLTALCVSGLASGVSLAAQKICNYIDENKNQEALTPEMQEMIRNDYKDAYLKVSQENEQLKAQLAELQK